jgi:uroporphyrinogen III methyltransferase/synthase
LIAAGGIVEQVIVYTSADVESADPVVAAALAARRIDWVTITSSSIARAVVGLFGEQLRRTKLASISPVTSQALRELGYAPVVEAQEYTMPGLVEAIAALR